MRDCTYFLYKAMLRKFPYVPSPETECAAEKLERVKARLGLVPEPFHGDMIDLIDYIASLADDRAGHAFQLGLNAGLSIACEGRRLQDER